MADNYGLKQFEPKRKGRIQAPVPTGARGLLFGLGILCVAIFLIGNVSSKWSGETERTLSLGYEDGYQPDSKATLSSVKQLIDAMNKSQQNACPKETLSTPGRLIPNNDGGTSVYYITTYSMLTTGTEVDICKDTDFYKYNVEDVHIRELFKFNDAAEECYPLIAPFNFDFMNANTDEDNKIVIMNKSRNIRVTFYNVLGWFCSSTMNDYAKVTEHKSHGTIVGASRNSSVTYGASGNCVGFGGVNTTVKVEYLDGGAWTPKPYEWLNTVKIE